MKFYLYIPEYWRKLIGINIVGEGEDVTGNKYHSEMHTVEIPIPKNAIMEIRIKRAYKKHNKR